MSWTDPVFPNLGLLMTKITIWTPYPIRYFRFLSFLLISVFRIPISEFLIPISVFRFPISHFRFPISDFRFASKGAHSFTFLQFPLPKPEISYGSSISDITNDSIPELDLVFSTKTSIQPTDWLAQKSATWVEKGPPANNQSSSNERRDFQIHFHIFSQFAVNKSVIDQAMNWRRNARRTILLQACEKAFSRIFLTSLPRHSHWLIIIDYCSFLHATFSVSWIFDKRNDWPTDEPTDGPTDRQCLLQKGDDELWEKRHRVVAPSDEKTQTRRVEEKLRKLTKKRNFFMTDILENRQTGWYRQIHQVVLKSDFSPIEMHGILEDFYWSRAILFLT